MAEGSKNQNDFQFKKVQLLKDQSLGVGAYGAVCKAKCDDLLCAAKIIHPTLFDPSALLQVAPQREHRLPIKRFEQECEFMSAIRHPNIVQYLGTFRDTDTHLPVLLLELMDDSLTHFLEGFPQPIPYHIQVNICHDVTLALSFLHSNKIVHRDLSSNNVLLIGNVRAKVADFGMARLGDINPQATRFTNTMCPGTDVYMPPEAVQDEPVYTEKIDCFSFGVLAIQILTRQFPKPGKRLQKVELNHPGLPKGTVMVSVAEVDRRQSQIGQVDPNHSLLPIALDCLKDNDSERPSAHQLCEIITDLKGIDKYIDSTRIGCDKDEIIRSQAICIKESQCTISSKEEENHQLRQELQQERERDRVSRQLEEKQRQLNQQLEELQQERDQARKQLKERERQLNQQLRRLQQERDQASRQLEERERQLSQQLRKHIQQERDLASRQLKEKERQLNQQLTEIQRERDQANRQLVEKESQLTYINQQLEAREQVITRFERQITELEKQLSQGEGEKVKASSRGKELISFKLRWREGKSGPCRMSRWYDAIVDGNTVYIRHGGSEIFSYDITHERWLRVPDCIHEDCSIVIINGWLTAVGGYSNLPAHSNELFSLTREVSGRRWMKKFPPMPTKRDNTTALCTGTALIVAGGMGEGGRVLSTVEVMNTETHQWSTAADLPEPLYFASATVCGDQIYMLGGANKHFSFTKLVYNCSMNALLQSCIRTSLPLKLVERAKIWRRVADLPVTHSACKSFRGSLLLATGGRMDSGKATTAVYMYDSITNTWEIISHMTTGRFQCFTAVLPGNQLMAVGGNTDGGMTDTVELGSLCN